jgi:hypothetical protein
MTTTVDTNVVVALWDKDRGISLAAQSALDNALSRGALVLSAPVLAELMAAPGRSETFIDAFLRDTGLTVDWNLDEATWRAAGRAFQKYAARRRAQLPQGPRRLLADFLIGAHAVVRGHRLLTLDDRLYRAAFPRLVLVGV